MSCDAWWILIQCLLNVHADITSILARLAVCPQSKPIASQSVLLTLPFATNEPGPQQTDQVLRETLHYQHSVQLQTSNLSPEQCLGLNRTGLTNAADLQQQAVKTATVKARQTAVTKLAGWQWTVGIANSHAQRHASACDSTLTSRPC